MKYLWQVTTQIHSATTVQQLDDIKKSYITDNNILKNMAMTDINSFNALIDKAKEILKVIEITNFILN